MLMMIRRKLKKRMRRRIMSRTMMILRRKNYDNYEKETNKLMKRNMLRRRIDRMTRRMTVK
jgi:hypothetical protein